MTHIKASVSDFLRGYITGYWQGWDFAQDTSAKKEDEDVHPHGNPYDCPCGNEGEDEGSGGSASGGADASSPAPALDPTYRRSAPALKPEDGPVGSSACADSSLPAIRQAALPAEVSLAGDLERIHAHRGMVLSLRLMASRFEGLGMTEAKTMCEDMISTVEFEHREREVES